MMKRTNDKRYGFEDLKICEITLQNNHYRLTSKSKRGANCLVYEAVRMEQIGAKILEHQVILKEFYPLMDLNFPEQILRNTDGSLKVPERIQKSPVYQHRLQKFLDSYEIMLELSKFNDGIEHTVALHSLIEANGTWYIEEVYDAGVLLFDYFETYDIFPSIRQFLNFLGYSLEIIGNLHKLGYYHLDLKPDNLSFTRSGIVRFIDTDSFVKISELQSCHTFPESLGFSAPELSMASERPCDAPYLIGPWTDIYSLAQFLCCYLFDRTVQYPELRELLPKLEESILYTDYYTDYQWFEKYSDIQVLQSENCSCKPLISMNGVFLLKRFLLKALTPRLSSRYRTAEEALRDLDRIKDCFSNYQFQLIDHFQESLPSKFQYYKELEHLEHLLFEYSSPKICNSSLRISQIQCTCSDTRKEFAKYYASLNRERYDSIHEISGTDLDAAFLDLKFFQTSGLPVENELSLAISHRELPTLLIFYDESTKTEPVNDGRFIKYLFDSSLQNLHLLFVTSNNRLSSLNSFHNRHHYPIYQVLLPVSSGKHPSKFYDKLWKYDWFLDLWINLRAFTQVFGWHLLAFTLTIAGLFSPLCMTIACHGYFYRWKKMSGMADKLSAYIVDSKITIFLCWLLFAALKYFFPGVSPLKVSGCIILWLILHYLEHVHRHNG